jgi:hypothetical protein
MDTFLETSNLPRLNHEEQENLNSATISKEIEQWLKPFQYRKAQNKKASLVHSTKHAELIWILLKLPKKLKRKEGFQTHFLGPTLPDTKDRQRHYKKRKLRQVWWFTSIIPALWRLRQEDRKFKASLGYLERLCLKKLGKISIGYYKSSIKYQ